MLCNLLPQGDKAVTVGSFLKEACFVLAVVKGEAGGLVQVDDDVKAVGDGGLYSRFHPCKALVVAGAVGLFKYVVVNGEPYVIQTP